MLEIIAGNLRSAPTGNLDIWEARNVNCARQELYYAPFLRCFGAVQNVENLARKTVPEILRWHLDLPVSMETTEASYELLFSIYVAHEDPEAFEGLRVGHLLGRTPRLLNMNLGELDQDVVAFSLPTDEDQLRVEDGGSILEI